MRHLARLVRQFATDERGVFAVIFGVSAIVLIALAGSVVDFVSMQQARNRAQVALDAATLALQPEIYEDNLTHDQIKERAEALVVERLADPQIGTDIDTIAVNIDEGSLYLEGELSIPTVFVSLVGFEEFNVRIFAEATRKNLALEVVMVLDNSGSMQGQRMRSLKEAADCATKILFYGSCNPSGAAPKSDNTRIGIVPFTIMVNIGQQFENADWLDWDGESPFSALNFDDDDNEDTPFNGPVDRRKLFQQTNTTWRGCVEARRAPYDTTDDPPNTPERLFIPLFSPDTGSGNGNNYISDTGGSCPVMTCTLQATYDEDQCYRWGWGGDWRCYGAPERERYTRREGSMTSNPASSCVPHDAVTLRNDSNDNGNSVTIETVYSLLSERELQERLCKYDGTNPSSSQTNASCPTATILPLTNDDSEVRSRISNMSAGGNTNIQQGAVWGMHALTSSEPMTEGAPPEEGAVSKVMIIMTDGFNQPDYQRYDRNWNGTNQYFSWGFRKDGRLADSDGILGNEGEHDAFGSPGEMTEKMDEKTVATCTSAKALDIRVYTIGLASNSDTQEMLEKCSSGDGYAYFPDDPDELVGVFQAIAGQLAQLRLAQ